MMTNPQRATPNPRLHRQTFRLPPGSQTPWVTLLVLLALLLPTQSWAADANDERFYQVVLVTVKDQAKYGEYLQALGPVVSRYGAQAHRIVAPSKVWPETLGSVSFVNVVSYESEEAFQRFERDPEFTALKPLRDAAITLKGVQGHRIGGETLGGEASGRPYMVEMVHYRDDDPTGFARYRQAAGPVMAKHGFHTEHRFEPSEAIGDLELPDAVAIHFFDSEAGKAAAEKDPHHGEIEGLYADAIEGLVWIEGQALSR